MPRTPPIYAGFFYQPLTEDVEELLARFQQTDSVRYEVFSAIWREMGFSDVFTGIISMAEMKRFCRVALATAVKYFLPPYGYQIRVGGLYLMFGLYHTQLAAPPVKIRLALKDWAVIHKFVKDSVASGHQDVVYIYEKLVAAKAIHYTAMPHFLSFNKQRKPKKQPVCVEFLERSTAVQELLSADILEELTNIQSQYEKMKEATTEVSSKATVTHRGFAASLKDSMTEFITWQHKTFKKAKTHKKSLDDDDDDDDDGEEEEEEEDEEAEEEEEDEEPTESSRSRARLLSSIKQKSYSNFQEPSKSRRHRQAEAVESCSSGAEQVHETAGRQRKRVPSLRARTWKSLGVPQEESQLQAWLLSAPEQQERVPMKRTNQTAPFKP